MRASYVSRIQEVERKKERTNVELKVTILGRALLANADKEGALGAGIGGVAKVALADAFLFFFAGEELVDVQVAPARGGGGG
jgi:hypothetical protein